MTTMVMNLLQTVSKALTTEGAIFLTITWLLVGVTTIYCFYLVMKKGNKFD